MDEFVKTITEKGMPEFISFDHDLAFKQYTEGFIDVPVPPYTVHSMNPVGRANIHRIHQSVYREG